MRPTNLEVMSHGTRVIDVARASAVALVGLAMNSTVASSSISHAALIDVITLMQCLALVWMRSHPVMSASAVLLLSAARMLAGVPIVPSDVLVLLAIYAVTARGPQWATSTVPLGGTILALLSAGILADSDSERWLTLAATFLGLVGIAWTVGFAQRGRLAAMADHERTAARLHEERTQQAELAATAERQRIAREMHDIVAHSLSVIIAQADGARYASASDPTAAARSLQTIADVGRASLADMRRLLGVLRAGESTPTVLTPQPVDADIEQVVAHVRQAGVPVALIRMGTERPVPPGLGLVVHRIVQEALTNVMKHAGPHATATIMAQWQATSLVLQIDDDGRGAAAAQHAGGLGLMGMKERAAIFGGSVSAGPRVGGGFRVRVLLPLPESQMYEGGEA